MVDRVSFFYKFQQTRWNGSY